MKISLATLACGGALFAILPAHAQTDAGAASTAAPGGLEEITVTSQRHEEALQKVPIAVAAFTSADLEQRQIHETLDIAKYVPNLVGHHNTGVGTANTYFLRGLGNTESLSTFDPPVGTYIDDFYISRQNANNFGFFDIERVEVLRGPQGTLFGRNTTGGAISIILKKPSDEYKGYVEAQYGSFNQYGGRASVDLPVDPKILTKFSFFGYDDDGYVKQVKTGRKLNFDDTFGARAAVRLLPVDNVIWDVAYDYIFENNTNQLNIVGPNGDRITDSGLVAGVLPKYITGGKAFIKPFDNNTRSSIVTSNLQWDFDAVTINAITGYMLTRQGFLTDSFGELPQGGFPTGGSPNDTAGNYQEYTQELKATGKLWDDKINYVAGYYFFRENNKTSLASLSTSLLGVPTVLADRTVKSSTVANAVYAQVDYHFIEDWTATAGLRYTDEVKRFAADRNAGALGANISTNGIAALGIPLSQHAPIFTPRFALQYQFDQDIMFYASATRGFKSGGWNGRATNNAAFTTFLPEKNWTEEVGTRADLFDKTLRVNVTGFYSTTEKIQIPSAVFINNAPVYTTTNPADLRVYGGEFEVTWVPIPDLTIQTGLGVSDAQYENVSASVRSQAAACKASPLTPTHANSNCNAGFVDAYGNIATPNRIPSVTWNASVSYTYEAGPVTITPTAAISLDAAYAIGTAGSEAASTYPSPVVSGAWVGTQWLVDFGVMFQPTDNKDFSITGECKNCFGKNNPVSFLPPFQFLDKPGTWDFRARYKFGGGHAVEETSQAAYVPPPAVAPATAPKSYLVFFDFNKSDLTPQAATIVNQAAKNAGPAKVTKLEVTGHTDTVGSDAYNMRLSRRRAESVAALLEKDGIPSSEIEIVAKGKRDLLVPTADGVKEPQNRRVQIVYEGGPTS
jgi:iron complex outermembrane receptor protein